MSLTMDEQDVRRLVRLLADALAPDDGRAAKVGRLMAGLSEWIGADGWFWVRSRVDPATGVPANYDFLYGGGLDEHHLAVWSERSLEVHGRPPENVALRRMMADADDFTALRQQLVPDIVWQEPSHQNYVRRLGRDGMIVSIRQLREANSTASVAADDSDTRGGVISYVVMLRLTGRPQFEERERSLVQAVIGECGPLHADGLNLAIAGDVATLTPRQRTVLALLIDGHGVKQVAFQLGLSPHTVNDYCKAIYRHFDVTSRGELVRRFMTGKV